MKKIFQYGLLLSFVGYIFSCAPRGKNPEEMIAAAKALDQRFITAYKNLDADGVAACYWKSPQLVNYQPAALQEKGWQEVKRGLEEFFSSVRKLELELLETNYNVIGDAVLGWGIWHMTIHTPDGQSMEMKGRFSDVKAERDGKWVYIFDHVSVPLPPPPDALPK
ncbi:MAG: YybH family protein [Calditrichia bacterium]